MDAAARRQLESYYPGFRDVMAGQGKRLQFHVQQEFAVYLLFLDDDYTEIKCGKTRFQCTNAPDQRELAELVHTISHRVIGYLE